AKAGDKLVLTKAIGTGIISTAAKAQVTDADTIAGAVASMRQLNRAGAEAMIATGVHAATDVTGFGLMGHLLGMMKASRTVAQVSMSAVPLLAGARKLVEAAVVPGGTMANLRSLDPLVRWHPELTDEDKLLLCDAQTSGGLVIAVPAERLETLLNELRARDQMAAVIGDVAPEGDTDGPDHSGSAFIRVTP
ncbi:MAG: selenide, water dikinase SelD, partial [Dehalococcoidia bacterium]